VIGRKSGGRLYPNFIVFCKRFPPFRAGVTMAGILPHVLWAELRYKGGGRTLHTTLFEILRRRATIMVAG